MRESIWCRVLATVLEDDILAASDSSNKYPKNDEIWLVDIILIVGKSPFF